MGGLKKASFFDKMKSNKSKEILKYAIKGMLPKNKLGRKMLKKLKLNTGDENKFSAQKPKKITI